MAASTGRLCGPCDTRHASTVALIWCTSCNEGLCETCSEHHSAIKGTRDHKTIPVSQYIELESFLESVNEDCESHGRKFDCYCLDHSVSCCISCIPVHHARCKNVKPIDELSKQAKKSEALPDLVKGVLDLQKTITEIKSNRLKNLDKMEKQRLDIATEIYAMKSKFNNYLDKLESDVLTQLTETCQKEKTATDNIIEQLKSKEGSIQLLATIINQIHCLPDIQVFLASKKLETKLNEEEKWTSALVKDKGLETNIKFSVDPQVERLMHDISEVQKFGKLHISQSPIGIRVGAWKRQQAQMSVQTGIELEDIHLQLVRQIEFEGSVMIKDCCTLSNGKLVFADFKNNKLLVYREDGKLHMKISTGSGPYGLAVIDNITVAVCCRDSGRVQIIDIDVGVVMNTINVNCSCHGLSYNEGKLYILVKDKGIEEYDIDGKLIRIIPVDVPTDTGYLCCCSDGFCYSCCFFGNNISLFVKQFGNLFYGKGFIAYCDVNGAQHWKSDVGNNGITLNTAGKIYVTDYSTNSLNVMSADGKRHKRLLSSSDGIWGPEGVYYNKEKYTLLVVERRLNMPRASLYRVV